MTVTHMTITIPLRTTHNLPATLRGILPATLQAEPVIADGLPPLAGPLNGPVAAAYRAQLRLHNQAGIPVISGQCVLQIGATELRCAVLEPLGIEAYAHAQPAQRTAIRERIWRRVTYATLEFDRDD
jgi:hypothetical protein